MSWATRPRGAAGMLAVLAALSGISTAGAATIAVTSTADDLAVNGNCTHVVISVDEGATTSLAAYSRQAHSRRGWRWPPPTTTDSSWRALRATVRT